MTEYPYRRCAECGRLEDDPIHEESPDTFRVTNNPNHEFVDIQDVE